MGKGTSEGDGAHGSSFSLRLTDILEVSLPHEASIQHVIPAGFTSTEIRLVVDRPLAVEQSVQLALTLQNADTLELPAKSIWCKKVYECLWEVGLEFQGANSDTSHILESLQSETEEALSSSSSDSSETDNPDAQLKLERISHEELGRLATLAKICEVFNSSISTQEIMQRAMEVLLEATGAQRCLLLIDRGHDTMEIPAACGDTRQVQKRYSRTVVNEVRKTGQPVLSRDVDGDCRFKNADSLKRLGVRSVLCVPVRTEERDFGLIYLDNSILAGIFTQKELQLAIVIAGLAASSLARAESFAQMIQGEKMAALGTMLTGTIHELNNPLTAILTLSEVLHIEGNELTASLMVEARRCQRLVNQLLQTARTENHTEAGFISLEEVVEHTIRLVTPELEAHEIELRYEEPESISEIKGNSDRLSQILLNLLFNSIYEVRDREQAMVEIRLFERQNWVYLVVADNGKGISPEHYQRVYDPFFTTKPAGEGTGMGLAVTHRLVKEHGGDISLENRTEGGALFTVSFPAVKLGDLTGSSEEAS